MYVNHYKVKWIYKLLIETARETEPEKFLLSEEISVNENYANFMLILSSLNGNAINNLFRVLPFYFHENKCIIT